MARIAGPAPARVAQPAAAAATVSHAAATKALAQATATRDPAKTQAAIDQGLKLLSKPGDYQKVFTLVKALDDAMRSRPKAGGWSARPIADAAPRRLAGELKRLDGVDQIYSAIDDTLKYLASPAAKQARPESLGALINPLRAAMEINSMQ